jgi:DNA-binding transcriptional ArsR family regulator
MSKNNFLLVDLNETKTKKLAETITSDTSRKILNYLTEKEDSEANIAKELNIPISTIHYHLTKLQESGLVLVEEFHYSKKGREINHYKLANKYIIIAPKKVLGLKEKLKGILPVGVIALGISAVIKLLQNQTMTFGDLGTEKVSAPLIAQESARIAEYNVDSLSATTTQSLSHQPDLALWFLLGSVVTIILYVTYLIIQNYIQQKRKN